MQSHLVDIDDPKVALHLFWSCLSLCKLNYLLRAMPPKAVMKSCKLFDIGLCNSLETIIHSSLNNTSWLQATLLISLGGLGLRLASTSAPAAFIGSLNSTIVLVSLLLDLDTCTHFNPPENEHLRFNLKASFSDMDINTASHKSLQQPIHPT